MHRRTLLRQMSGLAAGALIPPEMARATGQLTAGAANGVDWRLAFADLDSDAPPAAMKVVSGACPDRLAGALYRNGPAKFRRTGGSATHWFDGDGLVRAFRIQGGQASIAARFVDTPKRRADSAADAVVTPGFGTFGRAGLKLKSADDANAANISVLPVGPDLWALWEGGSPIVVAAADLSTLGIKTLRADLPHSPFLAHPRVEAGGDIWNLGVTGDKAVVWRLSRDGSLVSADAIDLPCASYVHDFTATDRYLVVILQPLIQGRAALDRPPGGFIDRFDWKPSEPVRILVIDKADLGSRRIYELPAFFAFHYGSAWAEADGTIRFDVCASADPSFATRGGREVLTGLWTPTPSPVLALITLPTDGQATMERTEVTAEFPRTDPSVSGWPRAYTIHATGGGEAPLYHALATYNWRTHASDAFDFGAAHLVEEAVFVPRPSGRGELDGWLLAPSVNLAARATELHVFDANRVSSGPVCSWRADVALPVSLHGAWVPA